jgi:transmembrane sensor
MSFSPPPRPPDRPAPAPDWQLLDRYLSASCSEDERCQVDSWLSEQPDRGAALNALRASAQGETAFDVDGAWGRVAGRIADETPAEAPYQPVFRASVPTRAGVRWRIAALFVLAAVGIGTTWVWLARRTAPEPTVAATREVVAPRGQRVTLLLRDSTRVVLNAGSILRYAESYGRQDRDVWLEGEAHFDVRHDDRRTFRVRTSTGIAEDVGTKFTVRAYPESNELRVAVAEGEVSLRSAGAAPDSALLLHAGELGVLDSTGRTARLSESVRQYIEWTDGRLMFESLPLRAALPLLARWYDVDVRITDPTLAETKVTASFRDESLVAALDALSLALDVRYDRKGRVVTIHR